MFAKASAWIERNLPTREQMARSRVMRPFANRVLRSDLWRFTRRSVPRGVALGMLVGIIVPFAQILLAALMCLPVRANVPVAALTTFVTNPVTTPLIWVVAYKVGAWLLRADAASFGAPASAAVEHSQLGDAMQWLTGATLVTACGLLVIAVVAAAASYVGSLWFWRWKVARQRRSQLRRRAGEPTSTT